MSAEYDKYLKMIPLYLRGQMGPTDQAEFSAFARAHPEFQAEVEDLRPAFEWLEHEFEVAGDTEFRLSPARRAELRRTSRSNVVAFPQGGARDKQRLRIVGKVSRWAAVAAVLASVSYLGLAPGRDTPQERIAPDRIAAASPAAQIAVQTPSQPAGRVYVYPPGYGLNRPDLWQRSDLRAGYIATASALDQGDPFPDWQFASPAAYGLDGPRPYYEFSTTPGMGAI